MDIEQLKLVLEAIKATTGDAKDVGLLYLAVEGVSCLVGPLTGLAALYIALRGGLHIARMCNADTSFAKEVRQMLMPSCSGYVTDSERGRMKSKIAELLTKDK